MPSAQWLASHPAVRTWLTLEEYDALKAFCLLHHVPMAEAIRFAITDLLHLEDNLKDLTFAATALLLKIEGMTSAEFTIGGESKERNALRATLTRLGVLEPDGN
mgnify:FL=1